MDYSYMSSLLLSLDLGTTHSKAGLFTEDGRLLKIAKRETILHQDSSNSTYFDPEELWFSVVDLLQEIQEGTNPEDIAAIGITSMAETGLLIDNLSGETRSSLLPWFDTAATPHATLLQEIGDPFDRFCASGIRPNFKCSLAKILWLRQEFPGILEAATWLSTADFIAYKLSGVMSTDYSLAGRTYAFNIQTNNWDSEWLQAFDLKTDIFPPALPSGHIIGNLTTEAASFTGLLQGTPLAICGHDHVCAAFATIGSEIGKVFDSMGTAEALLGILNKGNLAREEYHSGLGFGRYASGDSIYWIGGMSASGGSLEWLRKILGDPVLSYRQLEQLMDTTSPEPTGIIYFPYLSGSGSPHTDIYAQGALVGINKNHNRADLVKAVLEGTAFEAEFIRHSAQEFLDLEIKSIVASGGGTRMKGWMQIKSDVFGCPIEVPASIEAALLGAALLAGIGIGLYPDASSALSSIQITPEKVYQPAESRHQTYQALYQDGFLPLQNPLREVNKRVNLAQKTG
jgi:xylulokinase